MGNKIDFNKKWFLARTVSVRGKIRVSPSTQETGVSRFEDSYFLRIKSEKWGLRLRSAWHRIHYQWRIMFLNVNPVSPSTRETGVSRFEEINVT